jgi:predicted site-specific integrase-resolvase
MDRIEFMSTAEAAKMLAVSRQTLYNWLNEGKIAEPTRHPDTGYMQWTPQDIHRIRMSLCEELEGEA